MRAAHTRRRLRQKAATQLGSHTYAEWEFLVHFCGGRCVRCDAQFVLVRESGDYRLPAADVHPAEWHTLAKDHIRPLVLGGASDAIENLQPLCPRCNSTKNLEEIDWRPDGWRTALDRALAEGWSQPVAYCAGCSPDCRECNG